MNAKNDGWEHYTDETGRRHWRWPASDARDVRLRDAGQRRNVDVPDPSRGREMPERDRGDER